MQIFDPKYLILFKSYEYADSLTTRGWMDAQQTSRIKKVVSHVSGYSTADLKAVRGVYWSDLCNIYCFIPNENVGSLVFKSS